MMPLYLRRKLHSTETGVTHHEEQAQQLSAGEQNLLDGLRNDANSNPRGFLLLEDPADL